MPNLRITPELLAKAGVSFLPADDPIYQGGPSISFPIWAPRPRPPEEQQADDLIEPPTEEPQD
jgi:hypothetical protein